MKNNLFWNSTSAFLEKSCETVYEEGQVWEFVWRAGVKTSVWKWACLHTIFTPNHLRITCVAKISILMCKYYACESFTYVNKRPITYLNDAHSFVWTYLHIQMMYLGNIYVCARLFALMYTLHVDGVCKWDHFHIKVYAPQEVGTVSPLSRRAPILFFFFFKW